MRQEIPSNARIEIRLTQQEKAALKAQAEKMKMTVSDLVRMACSEYFQEVK